MLKEVTIYRTITNPFKWDKVQIYLKDTELIIAA
jgi:hypothetical protein